MAKVQQLETQRLAIPKSGSHAALPALTIFGASARAAAQSARRAGLQPFAADLFADEDLQACCPSVRVSNYPDEFPSILEQSPAGPWMYTGALENHPRLIERMGKTRPLLGNAAQVLSGVRDPWQIAALLARHGLPCSQLAADSADLPTDGTWLRKRRQSAGGLQVSVWRGLPRPAAVGGAEQVSEFYFQQRIEGLSCSAVYLAACGKVRLAGVTEQLLAGEWNVASPRAGSASFQYAGSLGPLPLEANLERRFLELGQILAEEFQLVGLFGVDCILTGGVPWPVEVNPRYTASVEIIERATGAPLVSGHVAACQEGCLPTAMPATPDQLWGKAILYARQDLVIDRQLVQHAAAPGTPDEWPLLADIPAVGTRIARGQPILTVFASGVHREVVSSLRSRLAEVEAIAFGNAKPTATI